MLTDREAKDKNVNAAREETAERIEMILDNSEKIVEARNYMTLRKSSKPATTWQIRTWSCKVIFRLKVGGNLQTRSVTMNTCAQYN